MAHTDYSLEGRFSRFDAKVGLSNDYTGTDETWRFVVYAVSAEETKPLFTRELGLGEVVQLENISVVGVQRFRLSAEFIADRDAPADVFRVCYVGVPVFGAVWADTELSR